MTTLHDNLRLHFSDHSVLAGECLHDDSHQPVIPPRMNFFHQDNVAFLKVGPSKLPFPVALQNTQVLTPPSIPEGISQVLHPFLLILEQLYFDKVNLWGRWCTNLLCQEHIWVKRRSNSGSDDTGTKSHAFTIPVTSAISVISTSCFS